ncbi:stalk domain-containing protein [Caldalkalibacillus salinus]|uniref:stalk domain-containing protein n=1 Tax=Caldalkalibacillus salinus TaxID=2803787 RepID=UPI0019208CF9
MNDLISRKIPVFMASFILLMSLLYSTDEVVTAQDTNAHVSSDVIFDLSDGTAIVDGEKIELDVPATVIDGRLFVPVRFLSEQIGFGVKWDAETRNIYLTTSKAEMTLNQRSNTAIINDEAVPFDSVAAILQNHLVLSVRTMADHSDVAINYDHTEKIVTVQETEPQPIGAKPIALFATDKETYKVGERIRYIDLSYHPDGTGIRLHWENNNPVFFSPGAHEVSLKAVDRDGKESDTYTRTIYVQNEVLTTREEYGFYYHNLEQNERLINLDIGKYWNYKLAQSDQSEDTSRTLVLSNSPETFRDYGLLYKETISGDQRIYATHVNGIESSLAQFSVMATNHTDEVVTIEQTQTGEVGPSYIYNLLGSQGLANWFIDQNDHETVTIRPGESIIYYRSETLYPAYGAHIMHDITVDGEVELQVIAHEPEASIIDLMFTDFEELPRDNHVRGTYDTSRLTFNIDGVQIEDIPTRFPIGDPNHAPWVTGKDGLTGGDVQNRGNYGVMYDITIQNPPKMGIALVPRGGRFKGAMIVNDEILRMPHSGTIEARTGFLIERTTGQEGEIQLIISPPSGSPLPFDLLFYPMDNRLEADQKDSATTPQEDDELDENEFDENEDQDEDQSEDALDDEGKQDS